MNNEDKILELLFEMKSDMSDFKEEMRSNMSDFKEEIRSNMSDFKEEIHSSMSDLKKHIETVENKVDFVSSVVSRMEVDHGKKLDALFDGYQTNQEHIIDFEPRITKLEREVERLSIQMRFLSASK